MRNFALIFAYSCAFIAIAQPLMPIDGVNSNPTYSPSTPPASGHVLGATDVQRRFIDQEKTVFDAEMAIRPYDVEEDHVWAAKRWVQAITSPVQSEEEFVALMWINGQQLAALQRQNKIYTRTKGSPKWASFVFEKEIEKELQRYCSSKRDPKLCLADLKEKALKVTEIFWSDFKKQAVDDFGKNGLDKKRVGFHQIRGHMREAYRDPQSPVWQAINDYISSLKASSFDLSADRVAAPIAVKAVPIVPNDFVGTVNNLVHGRKGLSASIADAKKRLSKTLGLTPTIENVPEERRPWNYVDSTSQNYDIVRASSRYAEQVVQSLGCNYFNETSLLNGQIIARILRKGSMDVAQLTQMTNRSVESWCYSQLSSAQQIKSCKESLTPIFAELNKYYWQEIKKTLEENKRNLSSADVDAYFTELRKNNAINDANHPLGKINNSLIDTLTKIKGDWDYQCLSVKDEALGDYRILKATQEQKTVADNLLKHLKGDPLRSPPGWCARSVKTAMHAAGIFKTYPDWGSAKHMAKGFEDENLNHIFLDEGYELQRIDTLNPEEAPGYAVIVYGGSGDGHVEVKVPTSELAARGITKMLGYGRREIATQDREFAYVSDYIDSAPRSSPKSRIARGDGSNNGRPVLGIYVIMRKS